MLPIYLRCYSVANCALSQWANPIFLLIFGNPESEVASARFLIHNFFLFSLSCHELWTIILFSQIKLQFYAALDTGVIMISSNVWNSNKSNNLEQYGLFQCWCTFNTFKRVLPQCSWSLQISIILTGGVILLVYFAIWSDKLLVHENKVHITAKSCVLWPFDLIEKWK